MHYVTFVRFLILGRRLMASFIWQSLPFLRYISLGFKVSVEYVRFPPLLFCQAGLLIQRWKSGAAELTLDKLMLRLMLIKRDDIMTYMLEYSSVSNTESPVRNGDLFELIGCWVSILLA